MTDYTQATDFSAKDALPAGDTNKKILGSDVDAELSLISTAIASKTDVADLSSTDSGKGAELVQFLQSGSSTSGRTVESKLQDVVNASDFSGSDIGEKINNAVDSVVAGGVVRAPRTSSRQSYSTTILWKDGISIDFRGCQLTYTGTSHAIASAKSDGTVNTTADGTSIQNADLIKPDIQASGACSHVIFALGCQGCTIDRPILEKTTTSATAGSALIFEGSGDSIGSGGPGGYYYNTIRNPFLRGGDASNQYIDYGILKDAGSVGVRSNTVLYASIAYTADDGIRHADNAVADNTYWHPSVEGVGGANTSTGNGIFEAGIRNTYVHPYFENVQYGFNRDTTGDQVTLLAGNWTSTGTPINGYTDGRFTIIGRGFEDSSIPFNIPNSNTVPVIIRKGFRAKEQPSSRATKSTNQTSIGGTWTEITWDSSDYDLNSDLDLANNRFVAPWAGRYQVNLSVRWTGLGDGDSLEIAISVGGTRVRRTVTYANGTSDQQQEISAVLNLSASDAVTFDARSVTNNNDILSTNTDTYFEVVALN